MKEIIKKIKKESNIFANIVICSYIKEKFTRYTQFRNFINDPFYFNIIRNHFIDLCIFDEKFETNYYNTTKRDIYDDIFSFVIEDIWKQIK